MLTHIGHVGSAGSYYFMGIWQLLVTEVFL